MTLTRRALAAMRGNRIYRPADLAAVLHVTPIDAGCLLALLERGNLVGVVGDGYRKKNSRAQPASTAATAATATQPKGHATMTDINEMFPSSYLRADDIKGRGRTVVIDSLQQEDLNGEQKWVVYFKNEDRGLVLNKTNAQMLAADLGNDTDGWVGKSIELRKEKANFQGRMVDAIRCYAAPFDDDVPKSVA